MIEEHPSLLRGRYRLLEKVGEGIMSKVYQAEDTKRNNMIVAVKLFESTQDEELLREVFRRETEALRRLEHPNIVEFLDYKWSPEEQKHFLVLEYLPRTLADELKAQQGQLDHAWCWKLAREIAEGLQYAHGQGVIHRDLKPTNILLTAEGRPKLTDFGSSYLKTELGNPITVSSFYTPEYASPEQLRNNENEKATERSDIYAFGSTLYHLFSGQKPPARRTPNAPGITPAMIRSLGLTPFDAGILESMVADDPADRPATCAILLRQLAHTQAYEHLPELWLNITKSVRRTLAEMGLIPYADDELAKAFLLEKELGGDQPKEVLMHFLPEKDSVRLLTDHFVLICVRHTTVPALNIVAFNMTYTPELEREKLHAFPVRYRWKTETEPAILIRLRGRTDLEAPLSQLYHQLQTHQQVKQIDRVRKNEQRDFTKAWRSALQLRRQQLDQATRLAYTSWVRHGKTITFTLAAPVPEDLAWPENAALAIQQGGKAKHASLSIGQLLGFGDGEVRVSSIPAVKARAEQPLMQFPVQGSLGLDLREARSQLNRLDEAVRTLLSGGTSNKNLLDILMDLSQAVFEQEEEIATYYQTTLAEDKKRAVKKALAARDLFLLQGPPGTGKTTALAELILHILERQPDARLLITSQSNVAVDHILLKVANLAREQGIEMIRIGREEKIGPGAEIWTIEQRQANWRADILSRTEPTIATLKKHLQELRHQRRLRQTHDPQATAALEQWKTRLDDLEPDLQGMEEDERRLVELVRYGEALQQFAEGRQEIEDEERQCRTRLEEEKARIRSVLTPLCAFLAETNEAILRGALSEEYQRLRQILLKRLGIEPEEEEDEKWLQFLKDWQKVAGIGEAFAEPLLERASILAATCLTIGREALRERRFDWAIIDEAGRATPPELLVPLVRARRAILVGDEKQLPPMVDGELSDKELASVGVTRESLTESLFGTLVKEAREAGLPIVQMLTAQHRMHPAIGRLISQVFYEGQLENAVTAQERRHELTWVPRCVTWYATTRLARHEETPRGSSFYNLVEIEHCMELLRRMEADYRALKQRREVAVISPYNAQIAELRTVIRPDGSDWQALHIIIAAVDAFQGQDSDIVLYSPVRSNQQARLGFLRDYRRLNVALSRARQLLFLIGDLRTLENGRESGGEENPYRRLIIYMRDHDEDCAIEYLEEV